MTPTVCIHLYIYTVSATTTTPLARVIGSLEYCHGLEAKMFAYLIYMQKYLRVYLRVYLCVHIWSGNHTSNSEM